MILKKVLDFDDFESWILMILIMMLDFDDFDYDA